MAFASRSYTLRSIYSSYWLMLGVIMDSIAPDAEERTFGEFRRKKATHKKASPKSRSRKPVDLQAIRETIANLVGVEAVEICTAFGGRGTEGRVGSCQVSVGDEWTVSGERCCRGRGRRGGRRWRRWRGPGQGLLQRLKLPVELPEDGELAAANVPVGDSVE